MIDHLEDPLYNHELSIKEHLSRAQQHAQLALGKCYTKSGTTRPFFFRIALAKAQSILMKLYLKELKNHK